MLGVEGTRTMDYNVQKLGVSNDKLTEINIQRKKVDDFIERWGFFFGYVAPEVHWHNQKYSKAHEHSGHSPRMVIETDCVKHFEQL